jgi:hypothetical protein
MGFDHYHFLPLATCYVLVASSSSTVVPPSVSEGGHGCREDCWLIGMTMMMMVKWACILLLLWHHGIIYDHIIWNMIRNKSYLDVFMFSSSVVTW